MDILFWVLIVPIILLVSIFLKSSMLLFHPTLRSKVQAQPSNRNYSIGALETMAENKIEKEFIEDILSKGKKNSRYKGASYRYVDANGVIILVFTDELGNIDSIAV